MSLFLPVDGCTHCITIHHVALAHPYRVETDGETVYGYYRCPECQYSWWTGWSPEAAAEPCPGCPACVPETVQERQPKRGAA